MEPKVVLFDEVTSSLDPELVDVRETSQIASCSFMMASSLKKGVRKFFLSQPREPRTRQFLKTILEAR
jgi:hypothetical protein